MYIFSSNIESWSRVIVIICVIICIRFEKVKSHGDDILLYSPDFKNNFE